MSEELDLSYLRGWIGSRRLSGEILSTRTAKSLSAILEEECDLSPGDPAPAGFFWCMMPDIVATSQLKADGHLKRSDLLPPVPLEKRMWASGRLTFFEEARVGDVIERWSEVTDVTLKEGQSGRLCFVDVAHHYTTKRGPLIDEIQTIVYRDADARTTPRTVPLLAEPDAQIEVVSSPMLLLRYSAITFNAHRIHYDLPYATEVEGYGGLVVHGPLQATLILNAVRRSGGQPIKTFHYRGVRPLIEAGRLRVILKWDGSTCRAQVADPGGSVTMEATAEI